MNLRILYVGILGVSLGLFNCQIVVDTVIDSDEMPISENAVYTDNGRFFVAGGNYIYEITGSENDFDSSVILEGGPLGQECTYGGMTDRGNVLFAICMVAGDGGHLVRIDPVADEADSEPIPIDENGYHLNGMDFGPDGALYISNSNANLLFGNTAVFRLVFESETDLDFDVEEFLPASKLWNFPQGGGLYPNGIRFLGNQMYFARGKSVIKTRVKNGKARRLKVVYRTKGLSIVDDFTIIEGNLFLAEAKLPGLVAPGVITSKLVVTDLKGRIKEEVALDFLPSSTAARRNTLFGAEAVMLTSFFNGGLHRVTVE